MRSLAVLATLALALASPAAVLAAPPDTLGLVDTGQGHWHLTDADGDILSFFFGNPGDVPLAGDWDCDGIATPGMFRPADGFVYLRNSSTPGVADVRFFFGNGGDVPLAGDFDGDGCDTVSVYRPAESRVYVVNRLGSAARGLGAAAYSYVFGDRGDTPFAGDFDGDGIDTVGLHRSSTGLVYLRQSNTTGVADLAYVFGDAGDRLVAGGWAAGAAETPAVFRPANATFHVRHGHAGGPGDEATRLGAGGMTPVAGSFGDLPHAPAVAHPDHALGTAVAAQVNVRRLAHDLAPLAVDQAVGEVAEERAWELHRLGYLTHSLLGSYLRDQLRNAGVPMWVAAENLGVAGSAEQVVALWMASPGHRDNVLDPRLDRMGAAVVDGPNGRYFVLLAVG